MNTAVNNKPGFTLWFTGLPCSGKTSLSNRIEEKLRAAGHRVEHLDGDVLRKTLCKDLGFSKDDRGINIERASFMAALMTKHGVATLVSFVSPYRKMRDQARKNIQSFIEVYVNCSLEVCEKRDVKGMYRLARKGQIKEFTGVSDPYEEPLSPEITVHTDRMDIDQCVGLIFNYLEKKNFLRPQNPFPDSELLTKAFSLADHHHLGQERKGGLPYITHPIAVAKILKEAGYGEEVIAAGLLHDVLEDSGCEREEMEKVVGEKVTRIVTEITDRDKTVVWHQRKENYLNNLKNASVEGLVVSCADKTHNLVSILEGYVSSGNKFAKQFSSSFSSKLENYRAIYQLIASKQPSMKILKSYKEALDRSESFEAAKPLKG